jgi:hypothetical protein
MKTLKIRARDIMHLREAGKLKLTLHENAFLYTAESVWKKVKHFHLRYQHQHPKSILFRLPVIPEHV